MYSDDMTEIGIVTGYDVPRPHNPPVPDWDTIQDMQEDIRALNRKVNQQMAATQAEIDALTQTVTDDRAKVAAAVAALQAEIASLQGAGVDVSGLQAAVAGLTTDVNADSPPVGP